MPTYLVELDTPLSAAHGAELARRVYYLARGIESFVLVTDDDVVTGVEIRTTGAADLAELTRKVQHVSQTEIQPQRLSADDPIWRSPHAPSEHASVFAELKASGAVHEMGEGLIAYGDPFLAALNAVDDRIRRIGVERFGATEFRYPSLIDTAVIRKAGYLSSFPHLLLSASRLSNDLDVYREFVAQQDATPDVGSLLSAHSDHSGYCLSPTVCFHTYEQLSGRQLSTDSTAVTAAGKTFRFENRYRNTVERMFDFTMREIVFVGASDIVVRQRQEILEEIAALADALGLAGWIVPANDPFFADTSGPVRVLAQRLHKTKYELLAPSDEGRMASVASFNIHGTTFGEPFGITLPSGETAHSACLGLGVDRLTFAIFCQHGPDVARWPAQVRAMLHL
jgi:seryl-tRNA synthetase